MFAAESTAAARVRKKRKENLQKRQEAYRLKQAEDKKLVEELLHKYDENNSGGFCKTQLRSVLIDIDPDHEPDDESLEFIMHRLQDENGDPIPEEVVEPHREADTWQRRSVCSLVKMYDCIAQGRASASSHRCRRRGPAAGSGFDPACQTA